MLSRIKISFRHNPVGLQTFITRVTFRYLQVTVIMSGCPVYVFDDRWLWFDNSIISKSLQWVQWGSSKPDGVLPACMGAVDICSTHSVHLICVDFKGMHTVVFPASTSESSQLRSVQGCCSSTMFDVLATLCASKRMPISIAQTIKKGKRNLCTNHARANPD